MAPANARWIGEPAGATIFLTRFEMTRAAPMIHPHRPSLARYAFSAGLIMPLCFVSSSAIS